MTIRAGESWGELVEGAPAGLATAADDAALASHLARAARRAPGDQVPVVVTGGDLLRTLGGPSKQHHLRRYPVDLLWVRIDEHPAMPAVAHVVAHGSGPVGCWRGPIWAVCNVSSVGRWDVAPRAHPNDGRLDVVEVDAAMSLRARLQARRRLPTGSHLPHPDIHVRRATEAAFDLSRRLAVFVDGRKVTAARRVEVTITPDAGWVHA